LTFKIEEIEMERNEKLSVDYKSEIEPEGNLSFNDLFEKYKIEEIKD
jgi:hypothetical protein